MSFLAATMTVFLAAPAIAPLLTSDFAQAQHTYPPESAVLYSRPFVAAHSEAVCASQSTALWAAYRLVTSAQGARYLLSPPVDGGSFGVFRYAIDQNGTAWGVKEFFDEAEVPTTEAQLRREWGLWEHLGRGVSVRDVLHDDDAKSTLVLMTLFDGNLMTLAYRVEATERALLVRGMLRQVASDASELHSLGFVHNDMRAPNMFWERSGRIVLADYGIAQHVDEDGCLERAPWPVVLNHKLGVGVADMVAAPEVMLQRYDARADTWGLGVAAVTSLVPTHPLAGGFMFELALNSAAYAEWRATLVDQHGQVELTRIVDPTQESVPTRHYVFHAVLHAAKEVDAALTQRVLQHLLVVDPAQRWSAAELAQATAQEGPSEAELAPLMQQAADLSPMRRDVLSGLDACAQSLEQPVLCDSGNGI